MTSFTIKHTLINDSRVHNVLAEYKGGLTYLTPRRQRDDLRQENSYLRVSLENTLLENIKVVPDEGLTKLDKEILTRLQLVRSKQYSQMTSVMEVIVPVTQLFAEAEDKSIHSELLGVTWYLGETRPNNHSKRTYNHAFHEEMVRRFNHCGNNFVVKLIDPTTAMPSLYMNIMGSCVEIPVVKLEGEAGLYIGQGKNGNPPEVKCHRIDILTKDYLEGMGIFFTRAECEASGNTERYTLAEKQCKDLAKDLDNRNKQLREASEKLNKAEKDIEDLTKTISEIKADHKYELRELKSDLKQHVRESRLDAKKTELKFDQLKGKGELTAWSETFKVGVNFITSFTSFGRLFS